VNAWIVGGTEDFVTAVELIAGDQPAISVSSTA
jgi:hypothetical protein